MKKILALMCAAGMTLPVFAADRKTDIADRLDAAKATLDAIEKTPDKAIPDQIMQKATCVAVVPGLKKAAFIVGGEYGQGVVTCRTGHGWSGPTFIKMTGGSFGFQIGGSGTDLILVAMNQKGMQDLLQSKFKIGGNVAAAAGPVGRSSTAATDWKLNSELLSYSRSKGLFAGVDLSGVAVTTNSDDITTFYGGPHTVASILKGSVMPPPEAKPFVRTVAKYFAATQAK